MALALSLLSLVVYNGDFPDPFVLRVGHTYYAYATNTGGKQVPTLTSNNLLHWRVGPDALPRVGRWSYNGETWAPAVLRRADRTYVLYYTSSTCIGRATARRPLGPFHDPFPKPLVCQRTESGSIDPSPFRDGDKLYLVWKSDGNAIGHRTYIWSQRLTPDGLHLVGPRRRLETNDEYWEGGVVEGPTLWRHGGRLYLFYSANDYAGPAYAVGYATCATPLGPCRDAPDNPILKSGCGAYGPGGETLIEAKGRTWILYHAWTRWAGGTKRVLRLAPVDWVDGKPVVRACKR